MERNGAIREKIILLRRVLLELIDRAEGPYLQRAEPSRRSRQARLVHRLEPAENDHAVLGDPRVNSLGREVVPTSSFGDADLEAERLHRRRAELLPSVAL